MNESVLKILRLQAHLGQLRQELQQVKLLRSDKTDPINIARKENQHNMPLKKRIHIFFRKRRQEKLEWRIKTTEKALERLAQNG